MTQFAKYRNVLADLGVPIRDAAVVMDFGCGDGQIVKEAMQEGFEAYGCDFPMESVHDFS